MKRIILVIIILLSFKLQAQTWDWVQTIRPGGNEYCWDVANDPWGNVLATGRVKATSNFGSGAFVQTPAPHGLYETDVFIAKYRPNGDLVWAKRDGGIQPDWGRCIVSDQQGNVFVTGDYCDSAYFGSNLIVAVGGATNRNIFLAKYDSSGVCLWVKSAGNSANYSRGYGVTTDQFGNSYITGHISGVSNFDGISFGVNGYNLPFIAKFSPAGTCIWVQSLNCQYGGEGNDIKMDKDGNLLVVGDYKGTIHCGAAVYSGTSSTWGDVFMAKLDQNGNFIWSTVAKGAFQDQANAVDSDSKGNIYVVGTFSNDLTFGTVTINSMGTSATAALANSLADVFLAKYNSSGIFQWVKTIGNSQSHIPDTNDAWADDITVTKSDKIIIGGYLFGNVNMSGIPLALDTVTHNAYVTAFDSLGNVLWYKLHAGPGNNLGVRGLSSDAHSNCFVGGEYSGDPYSSFDSITVLSYSGYDGLIAKLLPPLEPIITADRQVLCPDDSVHFNVKQDGYPITYQWTLAGASPGSSVSVNPTALYTSPGSYNVNLIVSNGHYSDTTILNNYITINTLPVVNIGPDTSLCLGQSLVLDAGSGFSSYDWSDAGQNQTNTVTTSGQYYVEVADAAGCKGADTAQVNFDVCTSLVEKDNPESVNIFPNPVIDNATIIVNGFDLSLSPVFHLYNYLGEESINPLLITDDQMSVDLSSLSNGIYTYRVIGEGQNVKSGKIIILKK